MKKQHHIKKKVDKSTSKNSDPSSRPPGLDPKLTLNQWADRGATLEPAAVKKAVSELMNIPLIDRPGLYPRYKGLMWYATMDQQDIIQKFRLLKSDEARALFAFQQRETIRHLAQIVIHLGLTPAGTENEQKMLLDKVERMLTLEL